MPNHWPKFHALSLAISVDRGNAAVKSDMCVIALTFYSNSLASHWMSIRYSPVCSSLFSEFYSQMWTSHKNAALWLGIPHIWIYNWASMQICRLVLCQCMHAHAWCHPNTYRVIHLKCPKRQALRRVKDAFNPPIKFAMWLGKHREIHGYFLAQSVQFWTRYVTSKTKNGFDNTSTVFIVEEYLKSNGNVKLLLINCVKKFPNFESVNRRHVTRLPSFECMGRCATFHMCETKQYCRLL